MIRLATPSVPFLLGASLALSCATDDGVAGRGLALRDPLDLIDDIDGPLRLLLFPSDAYTCETATGLPTPSPAEGRADPIPDAVVDLTFAPADGQTVQVIAGGYVILVRGWGTDVVSGRTNVIIASGCATQEIGAGETREVEIELHPVFGAGVCGDGTLSPDEQCEDSNTTPGDGCDATCRSEPFMVSRRPLMEVAAEITPAVAWAERSRAAVVYDAALGATRDVRAMLLAEDGTYITTPTALSVDGDVEAFAGVQAVPEVSLGGNRFAIAYGDFSGPSDRGDVRVRFIDADRTALGAAAVATAASTGPQTDPDIASMADGTAFVVFANGGSATGLSGRIFAAGSTTPAGASETDVGTGTTGAAEAAVAPLPTGFIVAFAAGGDVFYQRFGADGAPTDAAAALVAEGVDASGAQSAPDVATLSDGRALIVFGDDTRGIRARTMGATGTLGTAVVDVSAGGAPMSPAVAAGRERFVVLWSDGGSVRARMLDSMGAPALNREAAPSTGDFVVATGALGAPRVATGGTADRPMWMAVWQDTAADPMGDIRGRIIALP